MTLNITELPYHPHSSLNLFAPLSSIAWSMLLYSGSDNNHPDSRFDILVSNPTITFTTKNNITTISNNKSYKISTKNPFDLLKKYIIVHNRNYINSNNENNYQKLPFQGGLLGIFGYDLIRNIESLPTLAQQDLTFPDMAIGLYKWAIIADHKFCKNYLVSRDNPNELLDWIKKQKYMHNYIPDTSFQLLHPWKSNMNRSDYSKKFQIIKKNLLDGNCYQICLSQRFFAPYIGSEWNIFHSLLHHNYAPFSAFIRLPKKLSVLSLSPERFLQLNNSMITTKPIKGTLPKLTSKKDDCNQIIKLKQSIKDQSENLMIVDVLRNDIGKVAVPGSICTPELFQIYSFPGVHHMISTITGKLEEQYSAFDLLQACFPGGSITGAPKIQAMKIIEQLEPHRRNIWSGCIGYISYCGNMDTNIIIRTLLTEKQKLFCSVGSGITYDSNESEEYQEMQDKISTLLLPIT